MTDQMHRKPPLIFSIHTRLMSQSVTRPLNSVPTFMARSLRIVTSSARIRYLRCIDQTRRRLWVRLAMPMRKLPRHVFSIIGSTRINPRLQLFCQIKRGAVSMNASLAQFHRQRWENKKAVVWLNTVNLALLKWNEIYRPRPFKSTINAHRGLEC